MPRHIAVIIYPDGTTKQQVFLDRKWVHFWFNHFGDSEKDVFMLQTLADDALVLNDYDLELLKRMSIAAEEDDAEGFEEWSRTEKEIH